MLHSPSFIAHFRFTGIHRVVLYLPFLSLIAVASEILYKIGTGKDPFSSIDASINQLFINILLLNSLHLVFPFMILLLLPNGREFVRRKGITWSKNWIFGLAAALVVTIILIVSIESKRSLGFLEPIKPFIAESMIWVWFLVPTFHGMRQSAGVSQLIGSPNFKENEKYIRARKRERKLLRFYYLGVMSTFISQKWWATTQPQVIWLMSAVSMALAIAIIYNAKKTSAAGFEDKYIFSYRFLLWPLQPYSQIVLWSVIFNHGIEYIALIQHMLKSSTSKKSTKRTFITAIALGMVFISLYNVFEYIYPEYPSWVINSWGFSIVLALYPFFTLLHYAIDGVAYRMSDPDVQQSIGRFFVTQGQSS